MPVMCILWSRRFAPIQDNVFCRGAACCALAFEVFPVPKQNLNNLLKEPEQAFARMRV
jgi:hypothetical protein